jgi:hypothetical protein
LQALHFLPQLMHLGLQRCLIVNPTLRLLGRNTQRQQQQHGAR